VDVRPWSLDELPLPSGLPDGGLGLDALGGASYGGASFGGTSFGDDLGGAGDYGAGADLAAYADLPPLPSGGYAGGGYAGGGYAGAGLAGGGLGGGLGGAAMVEHLEAARADGAAEGYERGFAEGERVARAEREPAVAAMLATLGQAVEGIRAHEARWLANLEENVAALAVVVARHIVQREVGADPTLLRTLVDGALAQFPADQPVTVRVHPEELQAVRTLQGDAGAPLPELRWVADPAVGRGGCLVEGRERILDGRLDVALERAYRALAGIAA
jgi:flagellar biosynthesis/type III secretory pathway protein FliH